MLPPKKPTIKTPSNPFLGLDDQSPVNIGNKPKPKMDWKNKKLLTAKGLVIHLNLRPSIPKNPDQPTPEPNRAKLFAIPIREQRRSYSYTLKLDLPEQENPFYATEKHRQAYIEEQLRTILTYLGLTYYGDIIFEEWIDLVEKNGWSIDLSLEEAA